jgi:hypothetical protein
MLLQKLLNGVLKVLTPLGPRYYKPALAQRLYLLWIFRNFPALPSKVLSSRQRRVMDLICSKPQVLTYRADDLTILGTLEQRPAPKADEQSQERPDESVRKSLRGFSPNMR